MRAIVIAAHGSIDKLEMREVEKPAPGPGEVLVELRAAAMNHLDLWVRRGIPGVQFPLPLTPGCDGAGVIAELGAGVTGIARGARVVLQPGISCGHCARCLAGRDHDCRAYGILGENRDGTDAEFIVVPRTNVIPIAENLSFADAAAFPLVMLTAWHMAVDRARIQPGEDVLVHAGASGVGSAAIQIARLLGARVIATAGNREKAERARELGAAHVILYRDTDFAGAIREFTAKRGVDVILDHIGADTWEGNVKSLTQGGRLVVCGSTSGPEARTPLRHLFRKNLSFLGSTMGSKSELLHIARLVERGLLRPVVDRVLPLAEVGRAHELLESRQVMGKIVLRID